MRTLLVAVILAFSTGVAVVNADNDRVVTKNALPAKAQAFIAEYFAGKDIVAGASFDNNLPCIAEKECFAFANIADELISNMTQNGAYLIKGSQIDELVKVCLVEKNGKKIKKPSSEQEALLVEEQLKNSNFVVANVKKSVVKSHAPAPFITSTLQQEAARKLRFSAKKTNICDLHKTPHIPLYIL